MPTQHFSEEHYRSKSYYQNQDAANILQMIPRFESSSDPVDNELALSTPKQLEAVPRLQGNDPGYGPALRHLPH